MLEIIVAVIALLPAIAGAIFVTAQTRLRRKIHEEAELASQLPPAAVAGADELGMWVQHNVRIYVSRERVAHERKVARERIHLWSEDRLPSTAQPPSSRWIWVKSRHRLIAIGAMVLGAAFAAATAMAGWADDHLTTTDLNGYLTYFVIGYVVFLFGLVDYAHDQYTLKITADKYYDRKYQGSARATGDPRSYGTMRGWLERRVDSATDRLAD